VLVRTILSQNTNDRNSGAGFRRLKRAFPDWAAAARAGPRAMASAIRVSGLANVKSERIARILRRVRADAGCYSLEFLGREEPERAVAYLLSLPGVGPKTAACVMLFSFGKPVFPVDTHILRISRRLGLVDGRAGAVRAQETLQAVVPPDLVYPLHLMLIRHGRETCHARNPECPRCVLLMICPYGRSRAKGQARQAGPR